MATVASLAITQRQGSFQTSSVVVTELTTGLLRITADIPDADYLDLANSLWLRLYFIDPITQAWRVLTSTNWVGGPVIDPELGINPRPSIAIDTANYLGLTIRGELDIPVRMRIGCTIDLT